MGPQPQTDLAKRTELTAAYQAIVREGSPEVQEATLNRDLLQVLWPDLNLPSRCRILWEERFPELTAALGASARERPAAGARTIAQILLGGPARLGYQVLATEAIAILPDWARAELLPTPAPFRSDHGPTDRWPGQPGRHPSGTLGQPGRLS